MRKMKKIRLALAVLLVAAFFGGCLAFADDGGETTMFYNFDGYTADVGSRVFPDSNWTAFENGQYFRYGGFYDEAEDNYALKIPCGAEPTLLFGDLFTSGILHVSFRAKLSNDDLTPMFILYDGRLPGKTTLGGDNYSKTFRMNAGGDVGSLKYYYNGKSNGENLACWETVTSDITADFKDWHRFDIITTDMSLSGATINYYIDGRKINQDRITFTYSKGFKGFAVRVTPNTGSGYVLLDDVRIRRSFSETGIEGQLVGSSRVSRNSPTMQIVFSEGVDETLLTKENMSITNALNGSEITDFDILEKTKYSVKIGINTELSSGVYKFNLSSDIKGDISGESMLKGVEFRTEYKTAQIDMTFMNEEFTDYISTAENPVLPQGWFAAEETANTAVSAERQNGGGDTAFGVTDIAASREKQNFVFPFETPVTQNTEYEVSFDIFANNMCWYLGLAESGDITAGEDNTVSFVDDNAAIGMTSPNNGRIKYASGRSRNTSATVNNSLAAPAAQWNSVKIRVVPIAANSAKYYVSVNGGSEYEAETQRAFAQNKTIGLLMGFVPTRGGDNALYVDNIKVLARVNTFYPEIDGIKFLLYDGSELNLNGYVNPAMSQIVINFNTFIKEEGITDFVKLYEADCEKEYTYSIETVDSASVLTINTSGIIQPSQRYRLSINSGIESGYSSEVCSEIGEDKEFFTKMSYIFNLFENSFNEAEGEYTVKLAKNNNGSKKLTVAVAVYENIDKTVNGESVTFKKLKEFKYVPVIIGESETGVFEYICKANAAAESGNIAKAFLTEYPSLLTLEYDSSGELK